MVGFGWGERVEGRVIGLGPEFIYQVVAGSSYHLMINKQECTLFIRASPINSLPSY